MRAIVTVLAVLVVGLCFGPTQGRAGERELKAVRTVVVDPGHGGENKGALGYNGVYEKEVVLAIAKQVRKLFEEQTDGAVLLTRESDESVPLERRIRMANEAGADLFISLHCNSSFSDSPSGVETLVLSEKALEEESVKLSRRVVEPRGLYASAANPAAAAVVKEMLQYAAHRDARSFAELVQGHLTRRTKARDRGVKELPIVILRGAEMPGVVVEIGFISNPEEARRLARPGYQKQIAQGIVDAVIRFDATHPARTSPGGSGRQASAGQ